ncbi:PspC domain-containing protein [Streptomyces thermoviolaceus]|uniref:PspC domain-containing protein n=1 Tax=Streptomyces thermoviolaceus TaxID=1952 RepID=UPI00203FF952|nr:PspC domain-containing protein [Streptomyces thermoviolaceus]MCM3263715.1 PspC domain-containing protein [Streptomyces thermoviolaceus]
MSNHEHAATGPGPEPGPGRSTGAGPEDSVPGPGAHPGASGTGATAAGAAENGSPAAGAGPTASGGSTATPGTGTDGADGASGGPAAPGAPWRFRRDRRHKLIAGVCSGLGRQCDMDPVVFRITLAVLAATGGIGLLFYGFAWLFVPVDDEDENEVRKLLTGRVDGHALTAVLFALVGCGAFLSMLNNGSVLTFGVVLSLLLAGAGYWSQHRRAATPDPLAAQAVADAPPEAQAPPVPASYPSWWRDPIVKDGTHVGGTGYLWGPPDPRDRDIAAAVNIGRGIPGRTAESVPRRETPRPRGPRSIGGWVFLLALVAGFLGVRATLPGHSFGTALQTGLACALGVFGVGIALSAFLGRTGAGSVFLALVTAALLTASAALPQDVTAHWSHPSWRPASVADVHRSYRVGTGDGTLDLSRIRPGDNRTVTARAHVGVGRLTVIVPPDVTVRATIDVGVGDIQLPGDDTEDVDVAPGRHERVVLPPVTDRPSGGTLSLDLHVGIGQAEVSRAAS